MRECRARKKAREGQLLRQLEESEQGCCNSATTDLSNDQRVQSLERSSCRRVSQVGPMLFDLTCDKGDEFQKRIAEKVLSHPILRPRIPEYVTNSERLVTCANVCESLAEAWSQMKGGHCKDHYQAKNVVRSVVENSKFEGDCKY